MSSFKFLHAADLHLDSPLLGLSAKSPDFAMRVQAASRQAFENLLDLAIAEKVAFIVLAGDVFDGDLRNFQTGLIFTAAMRRLEDAEIQVFMISGNHDAENRYAGRLKYSANVHLFGHKVAESVEIEALGVVLHGQSFAQRDVIENLARSYPSPRPNRFNVGVLHTACAGSEGPHAVYAPCTVEQLVNHGYDYWALGHVHARAVLNEHPHVVYPGNLQGRHAREIGPKGATLVTVNGGEIVACEHRDLDTVRWVTATVDLTGAGDLQALLQRTRAALDSVCEGAGDRPIALRLCLEGETALQGELMRSSGSIREDIEVLLVSLRAEIWLEKLEVATRAPRAAAAADPTVSGALSAEISDLARGIDAGLEECLQEIRSKMPANARVDELFAQLRTQAPDRALALALSLVDGGEADHAD
ncbi:MAG: DNA repair exonuclease [Phenylobacterium sp.]|uniref:metallophosphoesterase family protein n=1 Tax=Phenylobacterium sp. TaxID=1871053 RepID=UPI0025EA15CC|nr:DNA repair exonuclease [Phenylobacterium sp.]MCA3752033.1 DNA repair exonuclease [Phenylobacterium sp.]MCA6242424.1 DNA repair exonuclease [Phenylobacterium sp.]MCA6278977.1 DNA repair exonuclease [Phenylobacterium sp.]MCA6282076.1 DNA repair exonuclease [Phenylobacterium sp.]MCA6295665.1 DNA repair exonuclease [Phenylobacterium sp.]